MNNLAGRSELYDKLLEKYEDNENQDITVEFYGDCIDLCCEFSKREIQFVLFELKYILQDIDTGIEGMNNFQKLSKTMIRDNRRDSFITNILETALEEKNCSDK